MNRNIQLTAFLLASVLTLGLTGCPHHHHHHHPPQAADHPGRDHHGPPDHNGPGYNGTDHGH